MSHDEIRKTRSRASQLVLPVAILLIGIVLGALFFGGGGGNGGPATENAGHTDQEESTLWTCSMHPQIKLPEPGKCPICFMDLIPLESGSGSEEPTQLAMSAEAMKLAEIATTPVERRAVGSEIRTVGKVIVDERRLKKITAWTGGRLERLFVDFTGVEVEAGDPLVEIYSPELYSAQVELLEAAKAGEELGVSGVESIRSTAETTIRATRERLRLLGLDDVQIDEIESRGTATERITIPSPIGGIVLHKSAIEGDYVKTGTPIYTIADLSRVWLILDAYESDLGSIHNRQKVSFDVDAFPGEQFEGTISFIDPVVDPKTRTVGVRVDVENYDGRLKPDMFVHARIETKISGGVPLVIPATAPLITGRRAVVYVRVPNTEKPTFEGRQVVLGLRAGDFYTVQSGLAEGELVVVKGAFKIDSEMQIQARPSMMSPEGGEPALGHQHGGNASTRHEEQGPAGRDTSMETMVRTGLSDPPPAFLSAMKPLLPTYLTIQQALATDDVAQARDGFMTFATIVGNIPADALTGEMRSQWTNIATDLVRVAKTAAKAEGLEELRAQFAQATCPIVALEKAIGPTKGTTHRLAFCPMAFENRGAYWVQTEEVVSNPYFGTVMPRCGEIQETYEGSR